MGTVKLALFASGNGTNVQQIAEYFATHSQIEVDCVIYNRKDAYVAQRAQQLGLPAFYFNKHDFAETTKVVDLLAQRQVHYIILAGFLLLIPPSILQRYPDHIINIHPALLPLYGGKGMYGHHVHEAVVANGERQTGITIHKVDQHYDRGEILFQATCPVLPTDTPDDVAHKVHLLEKEHYPQVIERTILATL